MTRERRRRRRQHSVQAVLDLRAGRLARHRPAHAEPGPALRLRQGRARSIRRRTRTSRRCRRRAAPAASPACRARGFFGEEPKDDRNNFQPRAGFAYDVHGNGRDVVRGGWGIYQDFGYTNANVLFAGDRRERPRTRPGLLGEQHRPASASRTARSSASAIRSRPSPARTRRTRRAPALRTGRVAAPRAAVHAAGNVGWAHQLTALDRGDGRLRARRRPRPQHALPLNYRDPATGLRRLADLAIRPNTQAFRAAISDGESRYDGLILGVRRRMTQRARLQRRRTRWRRRRATSARPPTSWMRTTSRTSPTRSPTCSRAVGHAPTRATGLGERDHPRAVGHPGRAVLPVPLGAADLHVRGCRPEPRRQQQRHDRHGLSVRRRTAWRRRRSATARPSTAAAARTSRS